MTRTTHVANAYSEDIYAKDDAGTTRMGSFEIGVTNWSFCNIQVIKIDDDKLSAPSSTTEKQNRCSKLKSKALSYQS